MYPEYRLIQLIEVPKNGKSNQYAVRHLAKMEYFDFDFMSKNVLKKFFIDNEFEEGTYAVIHENDTTGDTYLIDAVCIYRVKDSGVFMDFKLPGDEWKALVNDVLDRVPEVPLKQKIGTIHKISIPKIGADETK